MKKIINFIQDENYSNAFYDPTLIEKRPISCRLYDHAIEKRQKDETLIKRKQF
jgi:hypothetical protein